MRTRFLNIKNPLLRQYRDKYIDTLAKAQKGVWAKYVSRSVPEWKKIIESRTKTQPNGFPLTLIGINQGRNKTFLVGSIYATKGFKQLNSLNDIWIGGLYIQPKYRKKGYAALFLKQIIQRLINKNIGQFYFFSVTKKLSDLYDHYYHMQCSHRRKLLGHTIYIHRNNSKKILRRLNAIIQSEKQLRPSRAHE